MPKGYKNAKHSPHLCEKTEQECMVTTQHVKWDKKRGEMFYLETRIRSVRAITIGLPANNFLLDTFIVITKNRKKDKVILNISDHSPTFTMCSRVLTQDVKPQKQRTIELLCHYYCEIYCVLWIISPHVI